MKKYSLIGSLLLVLILVSFLFGKSEQRGVGQFLVTNSCEGQIMKIFQETSTSKQLQAGKRSEAVFALYAEIAKGVKAADLNFSSVMDLPKEDRKT